MIYAAEISTENVVLRVIVAPSIAWCVSTLGGAWIETSPTGSFRGKFAGIGDTYDISADVFEAPPNEEEEP
jgi:hypothetical protein